MEIEPQYLIQGLQDQLTDAQGREALLRAAVIQKNAELEQAKEAIEQLGARLTKLEGVAENGQSEDHREESTVGSNGRHSPQPVRD